MGFSECVNKAEFVIRKVWELVEPSKISGRVAGRGFDVRTRHTKDNIKRKLLALL